MGALDDITTLVTGKKKVAPKPQPVRKKKILIVEDDVTILDMYHDKFLLEGFNVIKAVNGAIGLAKAKSEKPDVILLDLMMPVMDGQTMLKKLREIPEFKKLPVVVLTNAGQVENIRVTKLYDNACDFLIKSNVEVNDVVKRVIMWEKAFI